MSLITTFKINNHKFFLFLLSLNYVVPILIFGKITLFYHDALDIEIVFNKIIGEIYIKGFNASDIFLAGEIKATYLRRLFQPYMFLYAILETELAYWIIDLLVKLTSYYSMYLLAKKINKEVMFCSLVACLYASINLPTHEGFGLAIFPYLIYLSIFKKQIKLKNFLIILFFGLNTDIVRILISVCILPVIIFIIDKKNFLNNFKRFILIATFFLAGVFLSNINIILAQIFDGPFHRVEFYREPLSLIENLKQFIIGFFEFPFNYSWYFFYKFPIFFFFFPTIFYALKSRDDKIFKFILLLLIIYLYLFLLKTNFINNLRYNSDGFIGSFGWGYIFTIIPLIEVIILTYLLKNFQKFNLIFNICIVSIILLQVNSSATPIIKKYFFETKNTYRNIYTFDGYYSYKEYKKIKNEVGEKRTLSIALDPMVAIMNNIKTIDGYHTLYPLSYKYKFRKIIENELNENKNFKNYFDNWGSRVYAFINDSENIKINFLEAKKIGAEYVISKFPINSKFLSLQCLSCENSIYLYKIIANQN